MRRSASNCCATTLDSTWLATQRKTRASPTLMSCCTSDQTTTSVNCAKPEWRVSSWRSATTRSEPASWARAREAGLELVNAIGATACISSTVILGVRCGDYGRCDHQCRCSDRRWRRRQHTRVRRSRLHYRRPHPSRSGRDTRWRRRDGRGCALRHPELRTPRRLDRRLERRRRRRRCDSGRSSVYHCAGRAGKTHATRRHRRRVTHHSASLPVLGRASRRSRLPEKGGIVAEPGCEMPSPRSTAASVS